MLLYSAALYFLTQHLLKQLYLLIQSYFLMQCCFPERQRCTEVAAVVRFAEDNDVV